MSVRVLLCDADDCLFPSEAPAFEASTEVTNRLLADIGVERRFTPGELRAVAMGKNFRATALDLAREHGVAIEPAELERRVERERVEVVEHLRRVLRPDPEVLEPLEELAKRFELAVVSSSALARLEVCFEATGLARLFPPEARFSAEDSLPVPTSKPDPAVYRAAVAALGAGDGEALAIEDSVTGVRSAVAAAVPVVGNLVFVPPDEREERAAALRGAGAADVVASWREVVARCEAPAGVS
jgi:HAD superfamily hydrolase (TIGR01509 family)